MTISKNSSHRRWKIAGGFVFGGLFMLGFIDSCDDRLVQFTQFVDPCGTFLANCQPGDFQTNAAGVHDWCVDPACTVPGQCGDDGPALGTITDICP